MSELITTREMLRIVDRSANYVRALRREHRFPDPAAHLGDGRGHGYRWDRAEIEAWAKANPRQRRPGDPTAPCSEPACERPAVAHGVCLMHYKRSHGEHPGSRPYLGQVRYADGGLVICEECGRAYRSVASHVSGAHGITVTEYREAHDLPPDARLIADDLAILRSAQAKARVGSAAWKRFEAARDPQAASQARGGDTWETISRQKRA